jgi:rhamnosyltransferase
VAKTSASTSPLQPAGVAALVVTYFPDAQLPERLDLLLEQFGRVAIVDNGSGEAAAELLEHYEANASVGVLRNESNLGIATALNQGLRSLAAEGFAWVVTFDQDSTIRPGFVEAMCATLNAQGDPSQVALIGANRIDPDNAIAHRWVRPRRGFPFFERVACEEASKGVTLVITSGTLTSIAAFEALGGFLDELFIDMVDNEYCLRAREHGYLILVSCGAGLTHKVGDKTRSAAMGVAVSATHHSPLRKYYLFRNSVSVMRSHGRSQPHWAIYHLLALGEVVLGIMLCETGKAKKLNACAVGALDGLTGKAGPSRRVWGTQSAMSMPG